VAGEYSLVRVISLCSALLYGQIQAITGPDPGFAGDGSDPSPQASPDADVLVLEFAP
jgi:hypothetical protein